jgi:hypothetical protein
MTTSEDDSTTYHRDSLYVFRHGRDTFPKSWKTLSTSSEAQEMGRKKGRVGGGVGRVRNPGASARTVYVATSVAAGV